MVPMELFCHEPWQGGYIDFVPMKDTNMSNYSGPPRTSLFDDLIYYHSQQNLVPNSLSGLDIATFFLERIIAGVWMNSISYIGMSIASLAYAVEQARKLSPSSSPPKEKIRSYDGVEWLEKNFSHVYCWNRRCTMIYDWTDCNLQELQVSRSRLTQTGSNAMLISEHDQRDWVLIESRLEQLETRSRHLVTSALGLLSLTESHKSVEAAESARNLALLGTVYLPLSLTAGILSMGGSFTPGEGHFWVFFAVVGPLMILSLAATYTRTLMRGLTSGATSKEVKGPTGDVRKAPTFVNESTEAV